jgi:hypothetical protein
MLVSSLMRLFFLLLFVLGHIQLTAAPPAFLTVADFGHPADQTVRDLAAKEAFKRKIPLWLDSGNAVLDINPTAEAA